MDARRRVRNATAVVGLVVLCVGAARASNGYGDGWLEAVAGILVMAAGEFWFERG